MKRILKVEVSNKAEFEAVQRAIQDPVVLAFLKVVGTLQPLRKDEQRRVLQYMSDKYVYEAHLS